MTINFCFSSLVAAEDIKVGMTGVGTIMEAVMTTTIAVVMVGTEATEVETTVILIKAAPTGPAGTTTITTEDVEAVADCKAAGPGGVGADFFFFVLEGALGLEDGLLAAEGALARAPRLKPSLVARGAATGGSIGPETFTLSIEDSRVRHLLELPELETFATSAMFCFSFSSPA